ncbi:6678_t:CDS:2 [Funneliformis caledonium]|uniref:6678_t:CDS:1 n=1 Tax=Funneliformis caledonium TaxID=1117310 RepID=A0A9N8Z548_9GLOM|nr:6678_t:CDS:2 [Funneliformis caledonium]
MIFIAWYLLPFLIEVTNSQIESFRPKERIYHTSTFINNKLYILGGNSISTNATINEIVGKEFFYLEFSKTFNTIIINSLWQDLTKINTVPSHWAAASAKGGINNDTLFLYGGFSNETSLIHTYDSQNDLWSIPNVKGDYVIKKRSLTGIIDYNGNMYLFGGASSEFGILNDMIILDTINLIWKSGSLINAPTPRFYYGANLLPNQNIIYFGGHNGKEIIELNEIHLYDIVNNDWNIKKTSGSSPSKRYLFSTVLDTINFEWYIPNVSGDIPANRYDHKSNVIGNFMVISFGFGYEQGKESDLLLLDISNNEEYKWSIIFEPSPSIVTPTSSLPTSTQSNDFSSTNHNSRIVLLVAIL